MEKVITISDTLYSKLEEVATQRSLPGIEDLLEAWLTEEEANQVREVQVEQVRLLRDRLLDTYGLFPDSSALIREDRER